MLKLLNRISSCGISRLYVTVYSLCTMSTVSGENLKAGDHVICRRLVNVPGDGEKRNDVIYYSDRSPQNLKQHVLFFGGDVQDYPENMALHPVNKRYSQWNLEETARLLQKRFPQSAIFIIKPTKMHLNTFSIFSNFAEFTDFGIPTLASGFGSWRQLKTLYGNILHTLSSGDKEVNPEQCIASQCDIPLKLVGFSKGCVILNQLLYDTKEFEDNPELSNFVNKIKEFYWLDGGHSGGSNTWVRSEEVVKCFSKLPVKVFVHVTPYQVKDPMRPWIGKEERQFVKLLKKFAMDVHETLHFETEQGSLENHFRVLTEF